MPWIDPAIALLLIMVLLLIMSVSISVSLMKRTICKIIGIFQSHNALDWENARTLQELGLDFRFRIRLLRDYRPYAFQMMAGSGIILHAPDGRFYLNEARLDLLKFECPNSLNTLLPKSPAPLNQR
ncbi:MAG: hypothetical protein PHR56_04245 [Dehalococcoidales bacterium]|nr:hypothetical protein [Dehalococcoidales bacterium]